MKAVLVRVGVDHSYGGWNAPVEPDSGEFVYVPIPEKNGTTFHPGCQRTFAEIEPPLLRMADAQNLDLCRDLKCPDSLRSCSLHLDPDFEFLTYGDVGSRRGSDIRQLANGDLLVFYAGLRPIRPCAHKLIYALVGLFVIDEVVDAEDVPQERWPENAHTRKVKRGPTDIIVRAKPGVSGRLSRCIPIGEYRDRAYRVRKDILAAWGDLTVDNGYIQRSARPPRFRDARTFLKWFDAQNVPLIAQNNPAEDQRVVLVHLRQPKKNDPNEMRSDPFWEFGSFGCTGCHRKNLMNPKRIDELAGVRLGFAQGGPLGFKLVMLTPPVQVVRHKDRCEARWKPSPMPFRYEDAPLLVDSLGNSDFPLLRRMIGTADRTTWTGRFSSCFRSRRTPLLQIAANEMAAVYERARKMASREHIAAHYADALPFPPNKVDGKRAETYRRLLRPANSHTALAEPRKRRC